MVMGILFGQLPPKDSLASTRLTRIQNESMTTTSLYLSAAVETPLNVSYPQICTSRCAMCHRCIILLHVVGVVLSDGELHLIFAAKHQ